MNIVLIIHMIFGIVRKLILLYHYDVIIKDCTKWYGDQSLMNSDKKFIKKKVNYIYKNNHLHHLLKKSKKICKPQFI